MSAETKQTDVSAWNFSSIGSTAALQRCITTSGMNEYAFHCEIGVDRTSKLISKDTLSVAVNPILGVHAVPLVGVYGDAYEPLVPSILLKIPVIPSVLARQVPANLAKFVDVDSCGALDFFVSFVGKPTPGICQHFTCDRTDEVNVVLHLWAMPDIADLFESGSAREQLVDCGAFDVLGASATHIPEMPSESSLRARGAWGLPVEHLDSRDVVVHRRSLSPCNNQLRLHSDVPVHSFWLFAGLPTQRAKDPAASSSAITQSGGSMDAQTDTSAKRSYERSVLHFQVIAGDEAMEKVFAGLPPTVQTIGDLLKVLDERSGQHLRPQLQTLVTLLRALA